MAPKPVGERRLTIVLTDAEDKFLEQLRLERQAAAKPGEKISQGSVVRECIEFRMTWKEKMESLLRSPGTFPSGSSPSS